MKKRLISSGSAFEHKIAYSRAIVVGDFVFVSGTTGYNYNDMSISESIPKQTEQCFENIKTALLEAGSDLKDIVRIRYILPNKEDFKQCWAILNNYLGEIRPAATMIEAGLINDEIKIEIEVTTIISRDKDPRPH